MTAKSENIRQKRIELNLSADQVGNMVGLSPEAVLRSEMQQNIDQTQPALPGIADTDLRIHTIARALDKFSRYNSPPAGQKNPTSSRGATSFTNWQHTPPGLAQSSHTAKKDLPILGRAQGGPQGNMALDNQALDWTYRPADLDGIEDAFAVFITGDSMEPKYRDGDLAYVHPTQIIKRGRHVLLETTDHFAFVKKFVKWDTDTLIVEQYNPAKYLYFRRQDILRLMLITGSMDS